MTKQFEALLFDLGGTLIYFDGSWPEVMQAANRELLTHLQEQGLRLDAENFLNEFQRRWEEYYAQRETEFVEYTSASILRALLADSGYPEFTPQMIRSALKRWYTVTQVHWKAEEDALPTLETLRKTGYHMGIISNAADDGDVQTLVDNAGLRPYFDFVLSSAACGIRKPNPRIFEIALEKLGCPSDRAVMVGDTLGADILGARNASLTSIWIKRRADTPSNRDHGDTIQPDASIHTLAELPDLLAKQREAQQVQPP